MPLQSRSNIPKRRHPENSHLVPKLPTFCHKPVLSDRNDTALLRLPQVKSNTVPQITSQNFYLCAQNLNMPISCIETVLLKWSRQESNSAQQYMSWNLLPLRHHFPANIFILQNDVGSNFWNIKIRLVTQVPYFTIRHNYQISKFILEFCFQ